MAKVRNKWEHTLRNMDRTMRAERKMKEKQERKMKEKQEKKDLKSCPYKPHGTDKPCVFCMKNIEVDGLGLDKPTVKKKTIMNDEYLRDLTREYDRYFRSTYQDWIATGSTNTPQTVTVSGNTQSNEPLYYNTQSRTLEPVSARQSTPRISLEFITTQVVNHLRDTGYTVTRIHMSSENYDMLYRDLVIRNRFDAVISNQRQDTSTFFLYTPAGTIEIIRDDGILNDRIAMYYTTSMNETALRVQTIN